MPDDLYDGDALAWAERQAGLLRRLAAGERVNDEVDWSHVIEEVQDVGLSQLRAVRSLLAHAMEHLLKIYGWPEGPVEHWAHEVRVFLVDASRDFTPSMRQRLNLPRLYREGRALIAAMTHDGQSPRPLPEMCPFTARDLIVRSGALPDLDSLLAKLAAATERRNAG